MISAKVTVKTDKMKKILEDLQALGDAQVLVGVPAASSINERKPVGEEKRDSSNVTNAFLAYIHDNGSPVAGIPAREFMRPGIRKVQNKISKLLSSAARAFLDKNEGEAFKELTRAGLVASSSIKEVINDGEGFEPLKRGTLLGRVRSRKYLKKLPKDQKEEVMASFHPLVWTGQLRNAITYVVRGFK